MCDLTGKALSDRAAELQIPGRSKMKADELRAAISEIEDAPIINREFDGGTKVKDAISTATTALTDMTKAFKEILPALPAAPLNFAARLHNYRRQNGCSKLTPRQTRRANKKLNKAGAFA